MGRGGVGWGVRVWERGQQAGASLTQICRSKVNQVSTEEPQGHDPTGNRTVFSVTEAQSEALGKESGEGGGGFRKLIKGLEPKLPQTARYMGPLLCGAGNLVEVVFIWALSVSDSLGLLMLLLLPAFQSDQFLFSFLKMCVKCPLQP